MKFILVRHGETVENREGIVQGHIDTKLSRKGIRQAEKVARELANYQFDAIYSSDLSRSYETSQIIAKKHPDLSVIKEYRLRELNFGILQGKPKSRMHENDFPGWEVFRHDFWNAKIENGETQTELYKRVIGFVNELIVGKFNTVLMVTHGGPILHIVAASKGIDAAPLFSDRVGNAGIVEVEFNSPVELKR